MANGAAISEASGGGFDFFGTINTALQRATDLATLDFLDNRGLIGNSQAEKIPPVQPVADVSGPPNSTNWTPYLIGGGVLVTGLILVLALRK